MNNSTFKTDELEMFYSKNVKQYRDDIRSLAWGSRKSQEKRFDILSQIANLNNRFVLDVGCGLGDFYGWLKSKNIDTTYVGMDISSSMIEEANKKFPNIHFQVKNILDVEEVSSSYDYVFASGIFNRTIPNHEEFVKVVVTKMFALCRLGVAFNIMSARADFMKEKEYYADPGKMLNSCQGLTRKVVLRHEYMPHDFTVYLYKE